MRHLAYSQRQGKIHVSELQELEHKLKEFRQETAEIVDFAVANRGLVGLVRSCEERYGRDVFIASGIGGEVLNAIGALDRARRLADKLRESRGDEARAS